MNTRIKQETPIKQIDAEIKQNPASFSYNNLKTFRYEYCRIINLTEKL